MSGQAAALEQLRAIERLDPAAVEIMSVSEPPPDGGSLTVDLSLDCRGIEHRPGGLRLRERERFIVLIGGQFPFDHPSVLVAHRRWAGTPHVQWGRLLCLYAAPAVEWQPADGMFGFIERLWLWLNKAAAGELDPAGAPLHPPVEYVSNRDDVPMVIPRADTPNVGEEPWIGGVALEKVSPARVDLVGWNPDITSWLNGAAPAILLPGTLDFEYPRTVRELLDALEGHGVERKRTIALLQIAAAGVNENEPLIVVIGTAMRGNATERLQHLSAWFIEPILAWGLRHALNTTSQDTDLQTSAQKVQEIVERWADEANVHWCRVREARSEVTQRRDKDSPMRWFAGKHVALWGCGALGAPIADWLIRAGVGKITLYDNAAVSPGVLVRQPFTDADIGYGKAWALAQRLKAIRPRDLDVVVRTLDVMNSALEQSKCTTTPTWSLTPPHHSRSLQSSSTHIACTRKTPRSSP